MSDPHQPVGYGMAAPPPPDPMIGGSDSVIDLDLSGVDAIHGWAPLPNGGYTLQVAEAKVVPTKDGRNRNIEMRLVVDEGPLKGRPFGIDRLFIPNRQTQAPEAYENTAGFFKGKVEAITGRPYGGKINVREWVGLRFKAIIMLRDNGYGPQNEITSYLPLSADLSGLVLPPGLAPSRQQNGGNAPAGAAPAGDQSPGRFRI